MPLPAPTKKAPRESMLLRLVRHQLGSVDIAWLAAYRVLFGLALAVSMQRFLAYGWVEELLVATRFRFHYWGFAWVAPLSSRSMHLLFWILAGLGVAVLPLDMVPHDLVILKEQPSGLPELADTEMALIEAATLSAPAQRLREHIVRDLEHGGTAGG